MPKPVVEDLSATMPDAPGAAAPDAGVLTQARMAFDEALAAAPESRPVTAEPEEAAGGPSEAAETTNTPEAAPEPSGAEEPTEAQGASLDDKARAYLRLKLGLNDAAIDAIPDAQGLYSKTLEREAVVDRTFRERAELAAKLEEVEAATDPEPESAVPAGNVDLKAPEGLLDELGLEPDGAGAKALEGWLSKALEPLREQAAETRSVNEARVERGLVEHRERLQAHVPQLGASDAAWTSVLAAANDMAVSVQNRGEVVDPAALLNQAVEAIYGSGALTKAAEEAQATATATGNARKAASSPTPPSRKGAEGAGFSAQDIQRKIFNFTQKNPHDAEGARALSLQLRREAGLEN